jgi:RNA polymerase sigma-70 factor (ECF subfamily)
MSRGLSGVCSDELVRHRPSLERSARKLCRNVQDAEDLVQTTLEKAWRARAQFLPGGNIGGWLYRILTNRHRDSLRRRPGVQVPLPDELPDQPTDRDERPSLLALPPEAVLAALSQLPTELREPLELMAVHGKRYREIADALALPVNTVGTRIRRARLMLQAAFAPAPTGGARRRGDHRRRSAESVRRSPRFGVQTAACCLASNVVSCVASATSSK